MEYHEEMSCGNATLHIQVISREKIEGFLSDLSFLNYRLANIERRKRDIDQKTDLQWDQTKVGKDLWLEKDCLHMIGHWEEGEVQKILVCLFAKKLEEQALYPFHASGVRYQGKNIMFMGGESNSGKSMSQIEGCRRGGKILSTETFIVDRWGDIVLGSKSVFLRKRAKGTERTDKPDQDQGIALFFNKKPEFLIYDGSEKKIDLVVLPDIDGHFETSLGQMSSYEKEYQTFHCICDYWGERILIASGLPMPLLDTDELRKKRASFISEFSQKSYYYIRGKTPQIILDEVEKVLEREK